MTWCFKANEAVITKGTTFHVTLKCLSEDTSEYSFTGTKLWCCPWKVLPLGGGGGSLRASNAVQYILEKKRTKRKVASKRAPQKREWRCWVEKDGTDFHGARARGHTGNKGYGVRFPFRLVTSFTRCFWDGKTHIEKCRHLKFDNCLKFWRTNMGLYTSV